MNTPPILTGKEAELNRAERMLKGSWTEKDLRLYTWCFLQCPIEDRLQPIGTPISKDVCYYMGEQIWPPT